MNMRKIFYLLLVSVLIFITSILVILNASGYRFDLENRTIAGTGIISVKSTPEGALVYVNDIPQDASNTNITRLNPGTYSLRLEKEGFTTWQDDVKVKQELVTEVNALLIPIYPSFRPLTFTGTNNPTLSPDRQKIAYTVQNQSTRGIWMLSLEDRPFNSSPRTQLVIADTAEVSYSNGQITWSSDSTEILADLPNGESYLINVSDRRSQLVEDRPAVIADWEELRQTTETEHLANLNNNQIELIKNLPNPVWSPNRDRILYSEEKDGTINYSIYTLPTTTSTGSNTPTPSSPDDEDNTQNILSFSTNQAHQVEWFPDSRHLLIATRANADDNSTVVEIIEYDGGNRTHVFSGNIGNLEVFSNLNGSQIIVLTKFNQESNAYNLYAINLR